MSVRDQGNFSVSSTYRMNKRNNRIRGQLRIAIITEFIIRYWMRRERYGFN